MTVFEWQSEDELDDIDRAALLGAFQMATVFLSDIDLSAEALAKGEGP